MNVFQLIKTVLDEAYEAIPGSEAKKDAAISASLERLSAQYKKLLTAGCLDYSDPATRFAYIYRYTTSHANLVYSLFGRSKHLSSLADREKLVLACIGGGPGSDFLGILKYCMKQGKKPQLKCQILDRDPAWGESWSDVDDKVDSEFRISTVFHPFDVTNEATWKPFVKHFSSDLFTMIYFVSEVYAMREKANSYFHQLFANIQPGAYVLFIDNNSNEFYDWFDQLAEAHGIKIIEKREGDEGLPIHEEKKDLGVYFQKFGNPKITANIAYRIATKPGGK
jgi:hypothetical protein